MGKAERIAIALARVQFPHKDWNLLPPRGERLLPAGCRGVHRSLQPRRDHPHMMQQSQHARQEKAMLAAGKANYIGASPNVDPLVRQLGELLRPDAAFLIDTCRRAGIHRQTLRKWLRGQRTPNLLDFQALLEVNGYTLAIQRKSDEDHQ